MNAGTKTAERYFTAGFYAFFVGLALLVIVKVGPVAIRNPVWALKYALIGGGVGSFLGLMASLDYYYVVLRPGWMERFDRDPVGKGMSEADKQEAGRLTLRMRMEMFCTIGLFGALVGLACTLFVQPPLAFRYTAFVIEERGAKEYGFEFENMEDYVKASALRTKIAFYYPRVYTGELGLESLLHGWDDKDEWPTEKELEGYRRTLEEECRKLESSLDRHRKAEQALDAEVSQKRDGILQDVEEGSLRVQETPKLFAELDKYEDERRQELKEQRELELQTLIRGGALDFHDWRRKVFVIVVKGSRTEGLTLENQEARRGALERIAGRVLSVGPIW